MRLNHEILHDRVIITEGKVLVHNISLVIFTRNMIQIYHECSYRFPNLMIGDIIVILIENGIYNESMGYQNIMVPNNFFVHNNKDTNNYDLVAHFHV